MPESPAAPVLVPPTPTINQGDSPEVIQQTVDNIQSIFDRVAPDPAKRSTAKQPDQTPREPVAPPKSQEPQTPPPESPKPTDTAPKAPDQQAVPSFIDSILNGDTPIEQPAAQTDEPVGDFPDELPAFKTPEESKQNWKNIREALKAARLEAKRLSTTPVLDEPTKTKLSALEQENKSMRDRLTLYDIQQDQGFQEQIIRPMQYHLGQALKVVKEAGGDPDSVAKTLALQGPKFFEALDETLESLPQSAKNAVQSSIMSYRAFDERRRAALSNPSQTAEQQKRAQLERLNAVQQKQKQDMEVLFDDAVRELRDTHKFVLLQTSPDPANKAWNEQSEAIIANAKRLAIDNTDMRKFMKASVLANSVDALYKLWLSDRKGRLHAEKILKEKFDTEPNLTTGGGNFPVNGQNSLDTDIKRPFGQVFLDKVHELERQGR